MTEDSWFVSKVNHSISQLSKSTPKPLIQRSWNWKVLWILTRTSRTNTQRRCSFHHRGLKYKSKKSRDIWSNRPLWPWSMRNKAKANRVLSRELTGRSKHLFQQHRRHLYAWTSPDGQYQNQIDYTLCSWRWRSCIVSKNKSRNWVWLRSWTPYCKIQILKNYAYGILNIGSAACFSSLAIFSLYLKRVRFWGEKVPVT